MRTLKSEIFHHKQITISINIPISITRLTIIIIIKAIKLDIL